MWMLSRSSKRKSKRRKALTSPNLDYLRWRYLSNGIRTWKARQSGPAHADAARVAEELTENGIVVGTIDHYVSAEGHEAFLRASDLVLGISRSSEVQSAITGENSAYKKDYLVHLVPPEQKHAPDSPLLRLALDEKLLEIVSLYLGMWPRLHSIAAWLNFPSPDHAKQSQLWHRDPEDIKLLKVFIYLDDVNADRGPFCYIPKTQPFGSRSAVNPQHADHKRITDDEMRAAIPAQDWLACTGPAGTMVLADTVGFHRGGKPAIGNRLLITFTYTSGSPFVKRLFQCDGVPDWASHPIQRYALLPVGV
jgi:hypothetical protein